MSARGSIRARTLKDDRQVWDVVFDAPRGGNGRRRQVWKRGFRTKREATRYLNDQLSKLDNGGFVEPSRLTLAEWAESWLSLVARERRASTAASYRLQLEVHVLPRIGGVKLQLLNPGHLDSLYTELLESGNRRGGGLSPRSVRYVHTIIRGMLASAMRKGYVPRNVATLATPPSRAAAAPKPSVTWTAEELRTFLADTDDRLYAAWHLLATTGMRRGEVLALRWSDRIGDRLSIGRSRSKVGSDVVEGETKSGRARVVDLDPRDVAVLDQHWERQANEMYDLGLAQPDLIFTQEDGSPIHPDRMSKLFDQRRRTAGLPRIRLHDLRHTYATIALAAGVHPKVVSERLGHSSVMVTMDIYSHVMPSLQEQAATVVGDLIFG